ncbi:MAG: hypothetical protein KA152_16075 [Verrucomicrobiales bacterium]|nr:hypothetical protein [Verrucomicrobiales bacterium]
MRRHRIWHHPEITHKNGESPGGTLVSEDASNIVLKIPDPASPERPVERIIALSDISGLQSPVSAMLPVNFLLSKSEIRDLVAYFGDLRGKDRKSGH